jgi:PilZ domain.
MSEQRSSKRYPISLKLEISSLFRQDNVKVNNIKAPIEVLNISRGGIGFQSESVLPLDYYFNAKLQMGDEDSCLYTVLKIIRQEKRDNGYFYGSEFVGLAPVLMYIFDEYESKFSETVN